MPTKTTIHDIARELNLSSGTISRALNNSKLISKKTILAVREKAIELQYQPNKIASSLRSGKSHTIGVLIPSAQINFFGSVVHGIETMASSNGYSIILYQTEETTSLEKKAINTFLSARVDGILASVAKETTSFEHFKEIQRRNIPLIFFDRTIDEFKVPSVVIDDYKGGFMATEHLIHNGFNKIAHIAGPQHITGFYDRKRGYIDALKKHQLPIEEAYIYQGDISIKSGREAIDNLLQLSSPPDAVFASEDYCALGVIKGLKERKINIPEEFGVIGFANENFGEHITPSLSTIDQQTVQMGEEAMNLLMGLIAAKEGTSNILKTENIILDPTLYTRESSVRKQPAKNSLIIQPLSHLKIEKQ